MKTKLLSLFSFVALAVSMQAANTQPVVAYTFACTGNAFERTGPCPQGGRPDGLLQGTDGNFYGAAQVTGEGTSEPLGGTVFSLTPSGKITILHTFLAGTNKTYPNGNLPGLLVEGSDGKLYGNTVYGGNHGCNGYCGDGVLYRVNKNGTGFQIIHRFCSASNCSDGGFGSLVAGKDGNVYGASQTGGTGSGCSTGCGAIYRVTPSTGKYEVIFSFDSTTTGVFPSNLVQASDGTFYGLDDLSNSESLFHFTPSTGEITVTKLSFPLFNGLPSSGGSLTFGPNGNFYGIYGIYGVSGAGVFEMQTDGSNLQLFTFYTTQDGAGTPNGMILGTDGNFWMSDFNGTTGYGDIIQLSPTDGSLMQRLTPFSSTAAVGAYPALIIQAKDGVFWGTTGQYGKTPKGQFGDGTVFSLNMGLPPQ